MRRNNYQLIVPITMMVALMSCTDDNNLMEGAAYSNNVQFLIEANELTTRGEICERADQIASIGVIGYSNTSLYIDNKLLTPEESGDTWFFSPSIYWPTDGSDILFMAYSPYVEDSQRSENGVIVDSRDGELTIDYQMPSDVEQQPDLMVADFVTSHIGLTPQLKFKHLLSAVRFSVVSGQGVKINSIEVSNICDQSIFTINSDSVTYVNSEVSDIAYKAGISSTTIDSNDQTELTTTSGYLMIPSQILNTETIIKVSIDGEQTIREMSFPGEVECSMGEILDLVINLDSSEATMTLPTMPEDGNYSDLPPSNCYIVRSHTVNQTITIPIEERINTFWGAGYDSSTAPYEYDEDRHLTTVNDWNNVKAELLWYDVDFSQTSLNLTSVNFYINRDGDTGYLRFTVQSDFPDGNMVVAVTKNNLLLWSWHFWFTEYTPYGTLTDSGDAHTFYTESGKGVVHRYGGSIWDSSSAYANSYIMDRNIGSRYDSYDGSNYIPAADDGSLLYQFGRKDPFPSITAYGYSNNSRYDYTPYDGVTDETNATTVATSVLFPMEICTTNNWLRRSDNRYGYSGTSVNIWNDPQESYSEDEIESYTINYKKSIFDPSPYGWKVPDSRIWEDCDDSDVEIEVCDDNLGIYYKIKDTSTKVFYPFTGVGLLTTLCTSTPIMGVWSSVPYSNTKAYNFSYLASPEDFSTWGRDSDNINNSFSIRCVTE